MKNKPLLLGLVLFFIGITFAFLSGFGIFHLLNQKSSLGGLFDREEPRTVQRETPVEEEEPVVEEESTPSAGTETFVATPSAEREDSSEVCGDWVSYTNTRFNYRFSYDPDWMFNNNMPGHLKDERIVLQGDISEKGWPSIEINSQDFDSEPETVAELRLALEDLWGETVDISEVQFGKNDIPAVKVDTGDSLQSYAMSSYYFIQDDDYLLLSLNDVTSDEAQEIYDCFIQNFETL